MFKKIILPNGSSVLLERIASLDTVTLGFWFTTGSADESKETNGYTHFIEHMLFKGTKKIDAYRLIKEIEGVGGIFNAFTSRNFTAFYISIISSEIDRALNILIDIIDNSVFDKEEVEREKRVIIEEIKMANDMPEERIGQQFFEKAYKGTGMALPIAGTIKNIKNIKRDETYSYYKEKFNASNFIISIAGNFDFDVVEKKLLKLKLKKKQKTTWDDLSFNYATRSSENLDLNQVYFSLMLPTFKAGYKYNPNINIINDVLGSSSSSRLFQNLREKQGLCYNIYSSNSTFVNTGTFEIHGSTSLAYYAQTIESVYKEIEILIKNKITKTEMEEAKQMQIGTLAFNKMSTDFLMNKNVKHEYYYSKHIPLHKIYKSIMKIDLDDTNNMIDTIFSNRKLFLSTIGPKGTTDITNSISEKLKLN